MRARLLIAFAGLLATLAGVAPATAQTATEGRLGEAARALESSPVYVDPSAERALSAGEAARLRRAIVREHAGPLYLAVLPRSAASEAGGDADAALREIALAVGRPGTYAAVIGDSFRAGLIGGVLPRGSAGSLAAKALDAHRGDGTAAVLEDFVRRVGDARAERGDDGGGFPFWILALFAIPAALYVWNRWRQSRRLTSAA
jgi:hypothetical protein